MASTSVYLPEDVRERLDAVAARTGKTRNALIVEACRRVVNEALGEWPEDFFLETRLSRSDLAELRAAGAEMDQAIREGRRSKRKAPL
ncbi:MAG: ribbon-helix-helix protein, CopG family [Polyangiaceae bacterium]|nr:ribbon-helix-helix protein, CopG family [Polyangiaceae bacterium]